MKIRKSYKYAFECPVKQEPLDRKEVLETGADNPVSDSVPQPLYKGVTDGNWNITNIYYETIFKA